ncbi:MAG: hypoxanthine phosphoribosyltransferase [Eubacteriales bacterium]|nr:hypoxanthine phosphoribosyltransferase [Eubacteriales bacterium]
MESNIEKILVSENEIKRSVKELGALLTREYKDKNPLLVGILKGCVVFMSDLMRHIDLNCHIDFMRVSSYGESSASSGKINIELDLRQPVCDYDVLIVEDIIDSGNTLYHLKNLLLSRGAKSLKICTLLDKPERRMADIKADYVGITIPNDFVVGYGLDFSESYRNLPYIGVLKPSAYEDK